MDENEAKANSLALLLDAAAFAAAKHTAQRRKDAEASPYINHPIAVARILCVEACISDPITLCAALLHDTIEDTATSAAELRVKFGAQVCDIVVEVSDDKSLPKEVRKQCQIDHAPALGSHARLVKLADKISNLRDVAASPPADWGLERRREYFDWAKAVVERIRPQHQILKELFDAAYSKRPDVQ